MDISLAKPYAGSSERKRHGGFGCSLSPLDQRPRKKTEAMLRELIIMVRGNYSFEIGGQHPI
jgi:hypothetical protein